MKKIDLQEIISSFKLDQKTLAEDLFPNNKFPGMALDRILKGEAVLDANQIGKLSSLLNIPVDDLYSLSGWIIKNKPHKLIFLKGDYSAELDMSKEEWVTRIHHKENLFSETVVHEKTIPVSKYVESLNKIVHNLELNKNKKSCEKLK